MTRMGRLHCRYHRETIGRRFIYGLFHVKQERRPLPPLFHVKHKKWNMR